MSVKDLLPISFDLSFAYRPARACDMTLIPTYPQIPGTDAAMMYAVNLAGSRLSHASLWSDEVKREFPGHFGAERRNISAVVLTIQKDNEMICAFYTTGMMVAGCIDRYRLSAYYDLCTESVVSVGCEPGLAPVRVETCNGLTSGFRHEYCEVKTKIESLALCYNRTTDKVALQNTVFGPSFPADAEPAADPRETVLRLMVKSPRNDLVISCVCETEAEVQPALEDYVSANWVKRYKGAPMHASLADAVAFWFTTTGETYNTEVLRFYRKAEDLTMKGEAATDEQRD